MSEEIRRAVDTEGFRALPEYAATVEQLGTNPNLDHETIAEVVDDVFARSPLNLREQIIAAAEQELHVHN